MLLTLLKGFFTSGSLIVAIGAQNAFVIKQGIFKRHLLLTALLCSVIDTLLIIAGVLGFGSLILTYPFLVTFTKYFAILFLFIYGALSLKASLKPKSLQIKDNKTSSSTKKTILIILMISLLNPHVYLDTVILLGSIASNLPFYGQIYFALGAISASFLWFFTITYGSYHFAPLLSKPKTWRVIDGIIAFVMWFIALNLFLT